MKKLLFFLFLALMSTAVFSQSDYKTAIGARFGSTYYDVLSFSYKNFVSNQGAVEFNVGFGSRKYRGYGRASTLAAALAYQHHFDFEGADGLKWFIGAGGTLFNTFGDEDNYTGFGLGVFPTAGLDFKFSGAPINLTLDLRPTFHIISPSYYNAVYGNLGFAIRYTLR
ncbi:MAG: hypothetical protein V4717_07155 [Bacteroidota bacterium]